ncbi:hypothetical protein [Verminephrobacter aporrectodeae]|uniref:hypothetical protein n=1 Tax=Verminephrobacter aporrectodeae TaxID=1110389 RepID=UPI00223766A6|nr:hypothetical protein [Verminephrobacter aporrectodeae]
MATAETRDRELTQAHGPTTWVQDTAGNDGKVSFSNQAVTHGTTAAEHRSPRC